MNEAITLRVAGEGDAGTIRAVTRAAYAKWVAVSGREPLPMRVDYTEAIKKHRFDLLFVGARVAALIETVPDGDALLIENVAVLPEFQHRGLGRQLLKSAEDLASTLHLTCTRLYTNKLFVENISLYESLGYVVEREEALNGGTAVHMTKPVAKS